MTDQSIEQEIQAKGLTAPRVTPADIEDAIASEYYFTAEDGVFGAALENSIVGEPDALLVAIEKTADTHESLATLTFCVLVLRNGFTVTGESACASPENFDAEIGRKIARENAKQKIWQLEWYLLKSKLAAI